MFTNFAKLIPVRNKLLLSLGLLLLFFSNCKDTRKQFTLDGYFKEFFAFGNGSEWTYVLASDTQQKMHMKVHNYSNGRMDWDAFSQEFIDYDLFCDNGDTFKIRAIADEGNVVRSSLFVLDSFLRVSNQWFYTTNNFSTVLANGDTIAMLPVFRVGDIEYSNVLEVIPSFKRYFKRFYIAKNIGFIRRDMVNGKTYLLKSYSLQ